MERQTIAIDYRPRRQFIPFHQRSQRFACIVTHRRAGKTVACIHDLHRGATAHESELRVDYPDNGAQVRLYGADNPDALRGYGRIEYSQHGVV